MTEDPGPSLLPPAADATLPGPRAAEALPAHPPSSPTYRSPQTYAALVVVVLTTTTTGVLIGDVVQLLLLREEGPSAVTHSWLWLGPYFPPFVVLVETASFLDFFIVPAALAAWCLRCRRNLPAGSGAAPRWSAGWAACGWLVPVANLIIPFLVLRETWTASSGRRAPWLLQAWWIAEVVHMGVNWSGGGIVLVQLPAGSALLVIGVITDAAALAGGIVIVQWLTNIQDRTLARLGVGPAGEPPTFAWSHSYRSTGVVARRAVIAIAGATLGALVMLMANAVILAVATAPLPYGPIPLVLVWVVGLFAYLCGLVGGAIAVPWWMHRAYGNLPALGVTAPRWSPGWAAAAWFVPLANLLVPYLIVRELWTGADPATAGPGRPLLVAWWTAWVASLPLVLVSSNLYLVQDINAQTVGDLLGMLGDVMVLVAGILAIVVVLAISGRQKPVPRLEPVG